MNTGIFVDAEELLAYKEAEAEEDFPVSLSLWVGNGYSGVKGSGNDLYGIREYQPGDYLKRINRQATARTGKIHLNEFLEERMLSAYIVLDQSPALFFTSTGEMKSVLAARTACKILFQYQRQGHRIGGEVFNHLNYSDFAATTSLAICEEWVNAVARFNQTLLSVRLITHRNMLAEALTRCVNRNLSGREIYVLTDFMLCDIEKCIGLLTTLGKGNRIYLIQLTDTLEDNPPIRVWLSGAQGDFLLRDESDCESYCRYRHEKKQRWVDFARQRGFSYTELFTRPIKRT